MDAVGGAVALLGDQCVVAEATTHKEKSQDIYSDSVQASGALCSKRVKEP